MDKFGIFKFLTSFLSFYQGQNTDNGDKKTNFSSVFQTLLSNKNAKTDQKSEFPPLMAEEKQVDTEKKALTQTPLTQKMLYTMDSHDKFIKRVMDTNKKNSHEI